MNSLRSLLLHIDASPGSSRRLTLAREVAALHGARLSALYASTPTALSLPFVMAQGAAEMLPMLRQLDIDHRDQAKARFDRCVSTGQPPVAWRELRGGDLTSGFAARALCSDLLVLGQYDPSDPTTVGVASGFVESVLLASGRPALVVPCADPCATVGQVVLIAWKATRESAHAVSAALPFLQPSPQRPLQIHVTMAESCVPLAEQRGELEDWLRLHGVEAPISHHAPLPCDAAGDAILSLAGEVGADLLVMGCYGHGRAREWILGGASRTVLDSMTLAVLMAH